MFSIMSVYAKNEYMYEVLLILYEDLFSIFKSISSIILILLYIC